MIHFASSVSRFPDPDSGNRVREPGQREPVSRDGLPDSGKQVRVAGSRTAGNGFRESAVWASLKRVPGQRELAFGNPFQGVGLRVPGYRAYLTDTVPFLSEIRVPFLSEIRVPFLSEIRVPFLSEIRVPYKKLGISLTMGHPGPPCPACVLDPI
jgi:hypothetical protein